MTRPIDRLLAIMARLRDPAQGCPWDREQDFATIAPYTIEEAYEVADAIERNDMRALKDELGDLLFQVVFHARMTEYRGVVSATMIYDSLPINDIFRKVDDDTVLGVMDLRFTPQPFFFILLREGQNPEAP